MGTLLEILFWIVMFELFCIPAILWKMVLGL